jgi:hypothetical protein
VSAGQDAQSAEGRCNGDEHEAVVATDDDDGGDDVEEDPDECVVASDGQVLAPGGTEMHVYDYFVVYSATYQVPVLYFQASHVGTPMGTTRSGRWREIGRLAEIANGEGSGH